MSKGINKVILIGNLGNDPDVKVFEKSSTTVCNFNVATAETWKDKNTGERKEATEWHKVQFFGPLAEVCAKYLKKGSQVYIEGKLKTEKYNKDGIDHWITKIIGSEMAMLGSKDKDLIPQTSHDQAKSNGYKNEAERSNGNNPEPHDWSNIKDEDIPF